MCWDGHTGPPQVVHASPGGWNWKYYQADRTKRRTVDKWPHFVHCPCAYVVTFQNGLLIVMRAAPKGGIREASVRSCRRFRLPQTSCTHRHADQISSGGTSLKQRWLACGDLVLARNMSTHTAVKRAILRCEELTIGNNI